MTKQNRIHKSLVVRERCLKAARKLLASTSNVYFKRRRRTCFKAFYKRLHKEVIHI